MRMVALVLVSLITLSACAVRPPAPHVTGEWQAIEAWQAAPMPSDWLLDGRVSMTAEDQSATVSIRWHEMADGYQIDLRGALGAGRVRVTGEEGQAVLATADGQRHSAGSPAELMQAVTGYDLPVEFLRWWVVGQPVPWLDGRVRVDEAGRALAMQQAGWDVRYDDYQLADDHPLPGRIAVSRNDIGVRLAVQQWDIQP